MHCRQNEKEYKQIGGGTYDSEGNQKKIGKWVELDEGFNCSEYGSNQITYNGEYNKNGIKIGRWDSFLKEYGKFYWKEVIYYNLKGQKAQKISNISEIYYIGQHLGQKKVGRWDIEFKGYKIGGGSYDSEGNQKKIGKWVELHEKFYDNKQITYNGQYNTKDMKVGRWDIMYSKRGEQEYKQVGGGSYDQEGNQKKIGKWVEIDEGFHCSDYRSKIVTYNGQYDMNNIKVGIWDIMHCRQNEKEYKQIGGGTYDSEGNQVKIGKWVELDEQFYDDKQITYNGQYNMYGKKVGRWDIKHCHNNRMEYTQIGGGSYDLEGNQKKIGKWVELDEKFNHGYYVPNYITHNGEYNMKGQKVGIWVEMNIKWNKNKGEKQYGN